MSASILLLLICTTVQSVEIAHLTIPRAVEVGSANVVLDCNYNFNSSEESGLELKWYFNDSPAPFFQWIAGLMDSAPQLIDDKFAGKIDLNYTGGSSNYTRYRALLLHSPTLDMAGTYTCKVSSLISEAVKTEEMVVYAPATSSSFRQQRIAGHKVNITCEFSGLYPVPNIKLTWGSFALFEDDLVITPHNDSYDVLIHKTLEHRELPSETVFGCELSIPGTEYLVREEAIYHHRGRRSLEMERIKELEASRQRKSKQSVFYNKMSRLDVGEMDVLESSSVLGTPCLLLVIVPLLRL